MLGVDFVINALFETSGLRSGGDCPRLLPEPRTSKTNAMKKNSGSLTARSVLECGRWESAKRSTSVGLFQFSQQLLLQASACCLFDRAPLSRNGLFLCLAFSSCSRFD
jgi:hypothetical protein